MVAVVGGSELGLSTASGLVLGTSGRIGVANDGRSGESVYVNAVTGNLVLQRQDETLVGRGLDVDVVRTYNSLGLLNDDNGDNWRLGFSRKVYGLTGTANAVNSTVKRLGEDGNEVVYTYDTVRAAYVSSKGDGAYDTITYSSSTLKWTWTDGDTQVKETYDNVNSGRLTQIADLDGNLMTLAYNAAGLVTSVTDANGDKTFIDYDTATGKTANIIDIRTQYKDANNVTRILTRVRYSYDSSNRLSTVTVDLSPTDNSVADSNIYVTTYTYDGTSKRVASLQQSDGSRLEFTYVQVGSSYRVLTVKDVRGIDVRTTSFAYDTTNRSTTITDPYGQITQLSYDLSGQLVSVQTPAVGGVSAQVSFAYDASGNVINVTDARGSAATYAYDNNGNRTLERDALGNTITRVFGTLNQLLTETTYVIPDPDGAGSGQPGAAQTTRFVYDTKNHLRFQISAAGRVTEYRYNAQGQRTSELTYAGNLYSVSGLTVAQSPTQTQMTSWLTGVNAALAERVDMTYDLRGKVSQVTSYVRVDSAGNGVVDGTQSSTQYIYDQAGNLLSRIDPRGVATTNIANDFITSYTYDGLGRVLTATDAAGVITATVYNDANAKTTITLANGLITTTSYDQAGLAIATLRSGAEGSLGTTQYIYDKLGRLREVIDPTGAAQFYVYDAAGRKVGEVDPAGAFTQYFYNANNQLIKTIHYANTVSASVLSAAQSDPATLTLITAFPGTDLNNDRVDYHLYDAAGRLAKSIGANGGVVEYRYDGANRVIETVNYATPLTQVQLSALFAMSSEISSSDVNAAVTIDANRDRHARAFYSVDNLLLAELDGDGYLVENLYDAAGRRVESIKYAVVTNSALRASGALDALRPSSDAADEHTHYFYNSSNQLIGVLDAENYLTEFQFDLAGNQATQIRHAQRASYSNGQTLDQTRPSNTVNDQSFQYQYDALNRLTQSTSAPDNVVTTYSYDSVGNLLQVVKALGAPEQQTQKRRFDSLGRIVEELSAQGAAALAALGATPNQAQVSAVWAQFGSKYTYDKAGRRASATDANGNTTLYFYDTDGRLVDRINALGEVSENTYNAFGDLVTTRQYATRLSGSVLAGLVGGAVTPALTVALGALADNALDSVDSYTFDAINNIKSHVDATGNETAFNYDAFGELQQRSLQIDQTHFQDDIFSYDRRGQLIEQWQDVAQLNIHQTTEYDAFGRAVENTDGRGNVWSTAYDKLGRTVQVSDPTNAVRSTSYDAFARELTSTDALGNVTSYSYNTANRTFTVTTPEGIQTITTKDRLGQTVSVVDGRGNTTAYSYDADGNLKTVTAPNGTVTRTYDAADFLIETIDANSVHTLYTYDAAGRMLTRTVDPTGLNISTNVSYDALGRAVWQQDANGVWTQTQYDKKGQVIAVTIDPLQTPNASGNLINNVGALNLTTTYNYDGRGKVLTVVEGFGSDKPKTTQYDYDSLGRRIAETVDPSGLHIVTRYTYDADNNLVAKIDAEDHITRYVYNARSELAYSIDATGSVTQYIYDANGQAIQTTRYANRINLTNPSLLPQVSTALDITTRLVVSSADEVVHTSYDQDGRARLQIDASGYVTELSYDNAGNVTARTRFANALQGDFIAGQSPTIIALNGTPPTSGAYIQVGVEDQTERTIYDAANRAIFSIDAGNYVTQYFYDNDGHVVKEVRYASAMEGVLASGEIPKIISDVNDIDSDAYIFSAIEEDQTSRHIYDAAGRERYTIDSMGHVSRHDYDPRGQSIQLIRYADVLNVADGATVADVAALLPVTPSSSDVAQHVTYDHAGRVFETIDAMGVITHYIYDTLGHQTDVIDAYGTVQAKTTHFEYDASGRVIAQTKDYGTTLAVTTQYVLDALGNRVQIIDPRGIEQQIFDADSRVVQTTNRLGFSTTIEYDAFGNAIAIVRPGDAKARIYFDNRNLAVMQIDAEGFVSQTSYNAFGFVSSTVHFSNKVQGDDDGDLPIIVDEEPVGYSGAFVIRDEAHDQLTQINRDLRNLQIEIHDSIGGYDSYEYDAFGNIEWYADKNYNQTSYSYDQNNRLLSQTDPLGYTESFTYDLLGNRLSYTDRKDEVTTYVYDAAGHLLSQTDPLDFVESFTYDIHGNRLSYTDKNGGVTTYIYDVAGQLLSQTDPLGLIENFTYDLAGNRLSYTDKSGGVTTYVYDATGHLLSQTSPMGVVTAYQYDHRGNRVAVVDAQGAALQRTTQYQYDLNNRLTDVVDANGVTTHYVYDAMGNVVEQHDAFGTAAERVTLHEYDATNHLSQSTDALGVITAYGYDGNGNRISKTSAVGLDEERVESYDYDANNQLIEEQDGQQNTTWYAYDANGNLIKKQIGYITYQNNGYGSTAYIHVLRETFYEYDENNRLIALIDGEGIRTEYVYDAVGNKIETIQAAGIYDQERHTLYAYDSDNRLVQVTDPMGGITQYELDSLGNQVNITDANGGVQHNIFDIAGHLLSTVSAGGILTVNTYDIRGNILSTTQSFANGSDARVTQYSYDVLNRKTSVTDGEGFTTTIQYDVFGNQTKITIGQYLVAANDAGFDSSKATRAHSQSNTFTYDDANRMLSLTDGEGNVTEFTYDAVGNRLSKTEAANTEPRTTQYIYDNANRVIEIATPEGGVTNYTYNAAGDKIEEWTENGEVTISRSFEYDRNGRMTYMRLPKPNSEFGYNSEGGNYGYGGYGDGYGITTQYQYDAVGNLLDTRYALGGSGYHTASSQYDLNDRKTADIDGEYNRTSYTYDSVGNRITVTNALYSTAHYYYDNANRLIGLLDPEGGYTAYTYDSAGNQVAQHQYAAAYLGDVQIDTPPQLLTTAADRIITTQYDRANHSVSIIEPDGSTTQKTYDGAGNLIGEKLFANTSAPRQRSYHYDFDNRLAHFTDVDGTQTYFTWDGANNKTSERIVSATDTNSVRETQYRYDLNNRLIEQIFDPNGLNIIEQTTYDLAGNISSHTNANGNTTYYYYDSANRLIQTDDGWGWSYGGIGSRPTYYNYDDAGNRIAVFTMPDGESMAGTRYRYDRNGRVIQEYSIQNTLLFTIANGWYYGGSYTSHHYDALGNDIRSIDAMENITTRYFDGSGHKLAELSADNVLTEWQYDAFGNAVAQTVYMTRLADLETSPNLRPTAPAGESRTTTTEYDVMGRVVRAIYPAIDVTSISVAPNNSPTAIVAQTLPEERVIYDVFGNIAESIDKAGHHTYSFYDIAGRCLAKVDSMGYLVEWDYDQQGNVTEQRTYAQPLNVSSINLNQRPTPPTGDVYTVSRRYDAASRLIEEYSPYVAVHDSAGSDTFERVLTIYEYDAVGNQTSRTLAAGTSQESTEYYYYDSHNQKIAVIDAKRVLTTFAYDSLGNVTQTKRFANPVSALVDLNSIDYTTTWDFQDFLVTSSASTDEETDFYWDTNNHLVEQLTVGTGPAGTYEDMFYGYDAAGRRTWSKNLGVHSVTDDGETWQVSDDGRDATGATQIVYDAMGRVTRTILPDGTSTVSEYDAAGNLIYQYLGNPLKVAVIGGISMDFHDAEVGSTDGGGVSGTSPYDWDYKAWSRSVSLANLPDLSALGSGAIRIDFHLDSWTGSNANQSFSGGDYSFSFAEGTTNSGALSFAETGIDDRRSNHNDADGPTSRTGKISIYKMVNGVAVAIGEQVPVTFNRVSASHTAGGGSRSYSYGAGSIVTKYSDNFNSPSVVTPATSIVASYGNTSGVSIAWSTSQYAKESWIVWDTTSHSDISAYASRVDAQIGSNSAVIKPGALSTGETIYFRVASADVAGNIIYSREESVTIPPMLTDIQIGRVGASGIHVVVTPPVGTQSFSLYYGNPGSTNTQVAMVLQANGTYTADVASISSLAQKSYRIVWADTTGTQYSTSEKKFISADEHLTATTSVEQSSFTSGSVTTYTIALGTQIPTNAATQYVYMEAVWKNSDIPNAPVHRAMVVGGVANYDGTTTFAFTLGSNAEALVAGHYTVTLQGVLPDNGTGAEAKVVFDELTLDVGSTTVAGIRQTLSWAIPSTSIDTNEQWVLIDGASVAARRDSTGQRLLVSPPTTLSAGNHDYQVFYGEQVSTSHTVTISSAVVSSGYDVAASITLDPAEVIAMGGHALTLSWRSLPSDGGFGNVINLTPNGNVFSGTVPHLVAGNYEAKLSYLDAAGSEVIVDLVRFSPQSIVQNFVAPPPAAITIGTRVNVFNERSNGFVGYSNSVFNGDDNNPSYGIKGSIANNTLVVNGSAFTVGELQIINHSGAGGPWKEFILGFNQNNADFSGSFSIKDANGSVLFTANFSDLKREVVAGANGQSVVQYICNSLVGNNYYYAGLTGDFLSTVNATASIAFNVTGMAANGVPISHTGKSFIVTNSETNGNIGVSYDVAVSASLTDTQLAAVNGRPVYLSWQQTSPAQGAVNVVSLQKDNSLYHQTLPLFSAGNYQLQLYYTNASNQKIVLDSLSIAATAIGFNQSTQSSVVIATGADDTLSVVTDAVVAISGGVYTGAIHDSNATVALAIHDTGKGASGKSVDGRTAGYYIENRFNAANELIATNAETGLWRTFGVDLNGNRVATYEFGVENNTTVHDSYALFDARNRLVTDYGVAVAVYGNTTPERLVVHHTYDALDREVSQSDNVGRSQTRQYNALGQVISQTDSEQNTTQHWYDRLGNETKTLDALLNTTSKVYNAAGELVRKTVVGSNQATNSVEEYVYDSFGRETQVKLVGSTRTITSQTTAYDQADRIISTTDALGNKTSFGYDQNGNRIKTVDASGHQTNFEYDGLNRLIDTSYDQSGININGLFARHWEERNWYQTHAYLHTTVNLFKQYDAFGNVVLEVDGNGRATQHKYGAAARKIEDTDVAGNKTFYEYDSFGKLIHEYGSTGKNIWRSYDALGRLVSVQDIGTGVTTTYEYDLAGNRIHEVISGVVNSTDGSTHNRDIVYSYDEDGRMTRWADSVTGMHLNYQWDADGNQKRVYTDAGYSSPVDHWYNYDGANRIISESVGPSGALINAYSYDSFGNRASWNNGSNTISYQYDDAGRVTSSDWFDNADWHTTWSYDNVGNMLRYQMYKNGESQWYISNMYTNTGQNFLTQKVNGTGAQEYDEVYGIWNTFDGNGAQLITIQRAQVDDDHLIVFNHSYYANGQERSIHGSARGYYPGTTTFTYDVNGRLIRQDMQRGEDMDRDEYKTFTYNTDGQILSSFHDTGKDLNLEASDYIYANGNAVGQRSAGLSQQTKNTIYAVSLALGTYTPREEVVQMYGEAAVQFNEGNTAAMAQQLSNANSHVPNAVNPGFADISEAFDTGGYGLQKNFDESYPASAVSSTVVLLGDTLQSIAARVYGNPSLWFVIADANGLDVTQPLTEGMQLLVPNTVKSGRIDSNAHAVYNQSEIIGSNLPNMRLKPQHMSCGQIFAMIIVIIIAIVIIYYSEGTASELSAELVAWAEVEIAGAAAIAITAATYVAVGAAIAAATSIIQQGVMMAMGYQHKFSWKSVGESAAAGAVSGLAEGVVSGLETAGMAAKMGSYAKVADAAIHVAGSAAMQYLQNGKITSWSSLAMAGMQGYFGFDDRVGKNEYASLADKAAKQGLDAKVFRDVSDAFAKSAADTSRTLQMVSPWLNAAESYVRGDEYKAEDWVGTVGQTLGAAYSEPGSNESESDRFFAAAGQVGRDLLIGGAMTQLNQNAGVTYLENAVGQDIGHYLGGELVNEFGHLTDLFPTKPTAPSQVRSPATNDAGGSLSSVPVDLYVPEIDPVAMPTLDIASEPKSVVVDAGIDLNLMLDPSRMIDSGLAKSMQEFNALKRKTNIATMDINSSAQSSLFAQAVDFGSGILERVEQAYKNSQESSMQQLATAFVYSQSDIKTRLSMLGDGVANTVIQIGDTIKHYTVDPVMEISGVGDLFGIPQSQASLKQSREVEAFWGSTSSAIERDDFVTLGKNFTSVVMGATNQAIAIGGFAYGSELVVGRAPSASTLAREFQTEWPYISQDRFRDIGLQDGRILAQVVFKERNIPQGEFFTTPSAIRRAMDADGNIDANILQQSLQIDGSGPYPSLRPTVQFFKVDQSISNGGAAFGRTLANDHLNPSGYAPLPQVVVPKYNLDKLVPVDRYGNNGVIGYKMINTQAPIYNFSNLD